MCVQRCTIIFVGLLCLVSAAPSPPSLNSRPKRQTIFFEDELDEQGAPNQGISSASKADTDKWLSRDPKTPHWNPFGIPAFPPNLAPDDSSPERYYGKGHQRDRHGGWHRPAYPNKHGHSGGNVPHDGFPFGFGHSPQFHGSWSPNQPGWNDVGNGGNGNNRPDSDRPASWLGNGQNNNGGEWNGNNQGSNGNGRGTGTWNGNQNWNGNNGGWNANQRPTRVGNNDAWNGNGDAWNGNNQRPNGNNQNSWNNNNNGESWNGNNQRPNGNNQNSWNNNNNGGSWNGNNQRPNGNNQNSQNNNNNGGSWNGNNQRPNGNNQNSWNSNNNGGSWNGNQRPNGNGNNQNSWNNNRPNQNAAGDNSIAPSNRPRPGSSNSYIRPPIAIGGVRPPSTPAPNCDCPATNETNPVCGTDGNTYVNPSRLRCARVCGSGVQQKHYGACAATTPTPNLRRG